VLRQRLPQWLHEGRSELWRCPELRSQSWLRLQQRLQERLWLP
jgi:hypothetical protein